MKPSIKNNSHTATYISYPHCWDKTGVQKNIRMHLVYLFILILIGSSILSCNKILNKEPISFASPEANYATGAQLLQALAGVYDVLGRQREQLYANKLFNQLGACTDEGFYARNNQVVGPMVYNFDFTDADIDQTWQTLYIGIERANNLIYYINTPKSMNPAERNAILGEAKFLRGYYYFLLVSSFGDVPLKLNPTTITGAASENVPRSPAKEVYAQVLKDMTEAEAICYPATTFNHSSRVSQTTVQGILARVCLTMAGYPLLDKAKYKDALQWATKVKQSGIHALNPSYSQIFINQAQDIYDIKEAMWEADFIGNDQSTTQEQGRVGNTNGIQYTAANFADTGYSYAFINVTRKLYELYNQGDLRRDWAIAPYGYSGTNRVNKGSLIYDRNCGKWRRSYEKLTPKSKNNTGINFPILRYADVLLMLAEADNQLNNGPTANAYAAFNEVRRRAYGFPVNIPNAVSDLRAGLSANDFQQEIIDERSRELCFEALRRQDLIRWGIWTQTMSALANQMNTHLAGNASWKYASLGATNAASSPKFLLYPIPASEFSVNKAATQNPGY
ncbi:RagB/SusD family nutrient uptake outer membrane protein [Haoranjiania flava]|uniref:RagB/SusD family nutrient uptake outer membrane protein n=1 Tax=Haoranjiania flava TaxID=1856322 RepID=A0AAE3LKS7_9BACT|nr:RagB/SusD family nutrient uptake outer membrane protein [Haoranjiania flava]MCU7694649.1 RagB/SusD family nutrient uptake outer membrane protein [Haoranjiania flava]